MKSVRKNLSKSQKDFLKFHNIELKYVFNAKGFSRIEYRMLMRQLNKHIAFNVTPCQKDGHTLRTRSGHCCQCNTATLSFQKRHYSSGVVYLAGSSIGKIIKVGYTKGLEIRAESLNRTRYAALKDWEILFGIWSENAGKIESEVNSKLIKYSYKIQYNKDNHWLDTSETYVCSYSKAREFIFDVLKKYDFEVIKNSNTKKYEFKNLIKLKDTTSL